MAFQSSFLRISDSGGANNANSRTVQLFITNKDVTKILLVHEKKEKDETSVSGRISGKPEGWGMPGGGVDKSKTEQELAEQIIRFLPVHRIEERCFQDMRCGEAIDLALFLTAVKEGIEETGLLICPMAILFEEHNVADHKAVVMYGEVVTGIIQKRSIETDDCDWFSFDELPNRIYRSHVRRIIRSLKVLGRNDLASKVMIEEAQTVEVREAV